jgi:UDP-arabinose 4-epimerase
MRVLVTGGSGYIGSHAVRALAARGHEAVIYDNLSTGDPRLASGFRMTVGDIRDAHSLAAALQGVDAIMHFAALAYVGESVREPRRYFENNVRSALTLLDTALDCGIRAFIFSSTCATYGIPETMPIAENTPQQPVNPYGVSKLFLEQALRSYDTAYGLRSVSLRYFNAAGADDSGQLGELHEPETHLIPCALQAAAGLRPEIEIFGSDYPTPDGTCIRDYIHVSDLAEAHVAALEYLAGGGASTALNLGTGVGHSVNEVIATVEEVTGVPLQRRVGPRRPGDPPVLVADPARAQRVLGWTAKRDLRQMVTSAWRWMQLQCTPSNLDSVISRLAS